MLAEAERELVFEEVGNFHVISEFLSTVIRRNTAVSRKVSYAAFAGFEFPVLIPDFTLHQECEIGD